MRYKEFEDGIVVKDIDGNGYGRSKIAGKMAIGQTAISRMTVPLIVMFVPSFIMCKSLFVKIIFGVDSVRTRFKMSKLYTTMFEVSL